MNLKDIMQSEISQSQRNKYCIVTHIRSLDSQTHRNREWDGDGSCQRLGGGGVGMGFHFGKMKMFWRWTVVRAAQQYERT